jgi:hypothetical protein
MARLPLWKVWLAAWECTPAESAGFPPRTETAQRFVNCAPTFGTTKLGTTRVGQIRNIGGDVISTSGISHTHATVMGVSPEDANRLLTPTQPNPIPLQDRSRWQP